MAEDEGWSISGVELTPEEPVATIARRAAVAEAADIGTVLLACHYNNRDPFATLALAADATETVTLGPAATNPYEQHPATLASQIATLQESSGGRALVGLGAGDRSTLRNLGITRERPLRRVLETMQVLRRLWRGDRVSHDGTFEMEEAGLNFDVSPPPVYIAAQGPDMLGMAAKYADGVLINAAHPRDYDWAIDRIDEGRTERSSSREALDVVAYAATSVADDRRTAREAARPPVAFIAGSAAPDLLKRHDIDKAAASRVGTAIEAGEFGEAFDAVTSPMIDAFCIAGTPDTVTERMHALGSYVDGIVAGAPLGPNQDAALEQIASALKRSGSS
jgi:5,10-methylenetetrahydromethanopterin reductase